MSANQLIEIIALTGEIVVETGLHIGASAETMEIGGVDNPVLRNFADNLPYIPGSSLKGKLRSLSEWSRGEIPTNGDVTNPKLGSDSAQVFGIPAQSKPISEEEKEAARRGPTRLIVRDAYLTEAWKEKYREQGQSLTEIKSENSINRLSAEANPRPLERVLPGVCFELEILFRVFDVSGDEGKADRERFDEVLLKAMSLLQADTLGGAGSRGCGKIRFEKLQRSGEPIELPELSFSGTVANAG